MRILIVEDELENAEGLAAFLEKLNPGDQCVIAQDGREGIDALRRDNAFDLVFADIRMPIMNGLDFLREARFIRPDLRVVMLSSYDSFTYAREALRLNAMDYMLKPMQPKEVSQLVTYVHSLIDTDAVRASFPSEYMQNMLGRWLLGSLQFTDAMRSIYPQKPCAQLALFCRAEPGEDSLASSIDDLMRLAVNGLLCEAETCSACLPVRYPHSEDRFIILMFFNRPEEAPDAAALRRVLKAVCDAAKQDGFVLVSDVFSDPVARAPKAFRQADALSEYTFYARNGAVLRGGDCAVSEAQKSASRLRLKEPLTALREAVLSGDADGARAAVAAFGQEAAQPPYLSPFDFFNLPAAAIESLLETLRQRLAKGMMNSLEALCDGVRAQNDRLDGFVDHMARFAGEAAEAVCSVSSDQTAAVFREVQAYIQEHLSDVALSQKDVSDHFFFSASYFSALFKKRVKQSFVVYLNNERITRAKNLLMNPEMNIAAIAVACGFQNAGYFTRVFKKHTGQTPQEYRRDRALGRNNGG